MEEMYTLESDGNVTLLTFKRNLIEDFELPKLEDIPELVIDFDKVRVINSMGIRKLIMWFEECKDLSKIRAVHCRRVFVDQMNMVEGLIPSNMVIESFYVPYYCEAKDDSKDILFTQGKEYDDQGLHLPSVTNESGDAMEIDVIESRYFRFLGE